MKKLCAILAFIGASYAHEEIKTEDQTITIAEKIDSESIEKDLKDIEDSLIHNQNAKKVIFRDPFAGSLWFAINPPPLALRNVMENWFMRLVPTLSQITNLTHLELIKCPLSQDMMNILSTFSKLKTLKIEDPIPQKVYGGHDSKLILPALPSPTNLFLNTQGIKLSNPAEFKKLKFLYLMGSLKQKNLDAIAKLPALRELWLVDFSHIARNEPYSALNKKLPILPHLNVLTLFGLTINSKNMRKIAQYSNLTELDVSRCSSPAEEFCSLENLSALQVLKAKDTSIDKKGISAIATLQSLIYLVLSDCKQIKGGEFVPLGNLKSLMDLDVGETNFNDHDMNILPKLSELIRINLKNCIHISAKKFTILENIKFIGLNLEGTHIDCRGLDAIQFSKDLRYLNLNNCERINDNDLMFLNVLNGLETLYLESTLIHDQSLALISQMPNLKNLGLNDCADITPVGFKHLIALKNLVYLSADNTEFNDDNLKLLLDLSNLREIRLMGTTQVSQEAIEKAKKSYPHIGIWGIGK